MPERGEDRLLDVGVVDTDRAAAELLAVPDDVVGLCPRRAGVVGVELARRRGERMVQRVPALLLLVPLHQRPVDDPDEPVLALGSIRPKRSARSSRIWPSTASATGRLVGDEQEQVALLGAEALG